MRRKILSLLIGKTLGTCRKNISRTLKGLRSEMSLRRVKHHSSRSMVRRSRSDCAISKELIRNVESGFEDINVAKDEISTDLRNIANKYDSLVLKIFNQRSHIRGDLSLLKKDAKLLHNEMKFLIVKHDTSTAFKKGFIAESHESERVLRAEIVTKEIGLLELSLSDLMSKYYYLLEQTKTLKEINSLWHIRSVMKSDLFKRGNMTGKIHGDVSNNVVKKAREEVRIDNLSLVQKLRWLMKLGEEFYGELLELRSAKLSLLKGRTHLEEEYGHKAVEACGESSCSKYDDMKMHARSEDVRQAEVRIIDALHERIDALDKLSESLKLMMIKAGFTGLGVKDFHTRYYSLGKDGDIDSATKSHRCSDSKGIVTTASNVEEVDNVSDHELKEYNNESDQEPEEIQVRYIRNEDVELTDLRCLSPLTRQRFQSEGQEGGSFYGSFSEQSFEISSELSTQEIAENTSVVYEEFYDVQESFTESEFLIQKSESEVTLTDEINNNFIEKESEAFESGQNDVQNHFNQIQQDRVDSVITSETRKALPKHKLSIEDNQIDLFIGDIEAAFGDEESASKTRKTVPVSTGKISHKLQQINRMPRHELKPKPHQIVSASPGTDANGETRRAQSAMDFDTRHERFSMARSFFEPQSHDRELAQTKREDGQFGINGPINNGNVTMSAAIVECWRQQDKTSTNDTTVEQLQSNKVTNVKTLHSEEDALSNSVSERPQSIPVSKIFENEERVLTPEGRPVFYDQIGVWQSPKMSKVPSYKSKEVRTLNRTSFPKRNNNLRSTENGLPKKSTFTDGSANRKEARNKSSTLPRKLKITSSKPISHIPRMSPEFMNRNVKETNLSMTRQSTDAGDKLSSQPASRIAKDSVIDGSSNTLPRRSKTTTTQSKSDETVQRTAQPRPISRSGSFSRRRQSQASDVGSFLPKPINRSNSFKTNNMPEFDRPKSCIGYGKNNNVSIYATLPRRAKKNAENGKESTANTANSQRPTSRLQSSHKVSGNNCPATVKKSPRASKQMIVDGCTNSKSEHGDIDINENSDFSNVEDEQNSSKKKKRKMIIKLKKPKSNAKEEPTGTESKTSLGEARKSKKSVESMTERAANFVHNAIRLVSSESKNHSKNVGKNHSEVESQPECSSKKRLSMSIGDSKKKEHRKSFIPIPNFS